MSKRRDLPLRDKVAIIRECEKAGSTQISVANEYGVSKSAVSKIMKRKAAYLERYSGDRCGNAEEKRQRDGKEPEVQEALAMWLDQKVHQGAKVTGPILKEKAKAFAEQMGKAFEPSDGWLSRWKKRYNIVCRKEHGEKRSADHSAAEGWLKERLPEILSSFSPAEIYNADKTGLYFRGLPDRSHTSAKTKLSDGKVPKERCTILACCNMDGSHKLPLMMIGKTKHPRCFPKDLSKLPLLYKNSKNAWMTSDIFLEWLQRLNRTLRIENRRIILLVDNCTAHPKVELSNIVYEFLPPKTTALIQPLDQGIIKNLKGHYRSMLNCRIITELDLNEEKMAEDLVKTITLLDAVNFIADAWDKVSCATIAHCFKHAGFCSTDEDMCSTDEGMLENDFDALHDVEIPPGMTQEELLEAVELDEQAATYGERNDEELLQIAREKRSRLDESSSEEEEVEDDVPMPLPAVLKALSVVRQYAQKKALDRAVLKSLGVVERTLDREFRETRVQKTVTEYFEAC